MVTLLESDTSALMSPAPWGEMNRNWLSTFFRPNFISRLEMSFLFKASRYTSHSSRALKGGNSCDSLYDGLVTAYLKGGFICSQSEAMRHIWA